MKVGLNNRNICQYNAVRKKKNPKLQPPKDHKVESTPVSTRAAYYIFHEAKFIAGLLY